jgi:hypothetical protein
MVTDNSAQRAKRTLPAARREAAPQQLQRNAAGQRLWARGGTRSALDCMADFLVKRLCAGESNPPIATATQRRLSGTPVPGDNP